jgi:double-stranded uracil-DNA glycosylase
VATEVIMIDGEPVETLKELSRPKLTVVIVGLNPSPVSVAAGHYFQGRLGRRLWDRLQTYGVTASLPRGSEDDAAFAAGIGFADIVRRPTPRARDLSRAEKREGAKELLVRVRAQASGTPLVAFVFADAAKAAGALMEDFGYCTFRLPSPFARKGREREIMTEFALRLRSPADGKSREEQ